jgi:hypothetical protein
MSLLHALLGVASPKRTSQRWDFSAHPGILRYLSRRHKHEYCHEEGMTKAEALAATSPLNWHANRQNRFALFKCYANADSLGITLFVQMRNTVPPNLTASLPILLTAMYGDSVGIRSTALANSHTTKPTCQHCTRYLHIGCDQTIGLKPISYRGMLLSTLLRFTAKYLHNTLDVPGK